MKAQTGIEGAVEPTALVAATPGIRVEEPVVDPGSAVRVAVLASVQGERYELFLDDVAVRRARNGNGENLVFVTEPVYRDTRFRLSITRPGDSGIPLERTVDLPVRTRPEAGLAVGAAEASVDHGAGTEIRIASSQAGVLYRLGAAGEPIGAAVPGTGAAVALATGPLLADTEFSVHAARADDPQISVELAQRVTVTVRPGAG